MWRDILSVALTMGAALFILHKFRPRDKWGVRSTFEKEE